MIIEFSVGNYRSIKNIQTLRLTAAKIKSKNPELDKQNVLHVNDKLNLLKSKALYGANASGKSNIIRALVSFIAIVHSSVKEEKILNRRIEPFYLSTDNEEQPSFFQLVFIVDKIQYRYGFEANDNIIISEWLFGTPGVKEVEYFTREGSNIHVNEKRFKEGSRFTGTINEEADITRPNSLFLTAVKALNGDISKMLINYISGIMVVTGLYDKLMYKIAGDALNDDSSKQKIADLLKIADTGIEDIHRIELDKENIHNDSQELTKDIESDKKASIILTAHKKFDSNNKHIETISYPLIEHESEGSKKMFEISPFIITALESNRPLIIDEFDARFHPLLTKKLVELFNSNVNKGTQFVIVTHDINLLNGALLRRDQIGFIEKDKFGATRLYDLVKFKGVRNDASFDKDYILGKYGAIPFVKDFETAL